MEKNQTLSQKVYDLLLKRRKKPLTLSELATLSKSNLKSIRSAIKELQTSGKAISILGNVVELTTEIQKKKPFVIDNRHLTGKVVKFGYTTDNHLGSKYERLDVLNALYQRFHEEGITDVYNTGNMIDGVAKFNKYDLHKHGYEEQVNYIVEVFPKYFNMTTHFITGDKLVVPSKSGYMLETLVKSSLLAQCSENVKNRDNQQGRLLVREPSETTCLIYYVKDHKV